MCRNIPGAVGNLLSLPIATHGEVVLVIVSRWINAKPNKLAKFIDYCINKVLKLKQVVGSYDLVINL